MPTYVSMLRGINVSGKNKIKMDDLRKLYEAVGHADVITYIQSGNVIFKSPSDQSADLARGIEQRIAGELGLEVRVLLRSADELASVIESNPFHSEGVDPSKLHVTFLAEQCDPTRNASIQVPGDGPDEFRIVGREIYLYCPEGYGETKLNNAFWERRLRAAATTRNWNTVTKLLQLARR